MDTVNTSVKTNQKLLLSAFLNSLYYVFPFGMFLTACNFLFKSVRNYYFDWMIVVLPTIAICAIVSLYEMFIIYQKCEFFMKAENAFTSKQGRYLISNSNLATS